MSTNDGELKKLSLSSGISKIAASSANESEAGYRGHKNE
jgi:hypothetical protein